MGVLLVAGLVFISLTGARETPGGGVMMRAAATEAAASRPWSGKEGGATHNVGE